MVHAAGIGDTSCMGYAPRAHEPRAPSAHAGADPAGHRVRRGPSRTADAAHRRDKALALLAAAPSTGLTLNELQKLFAAPLSLVSSALVELEHQGAVRLNRTRWELRATGEPPRAATTDRGLGWKP